jgi:ERF superfamily
MAASESTGLLAAMLAVQSEASTLPKDAINPHFKARYTPLDTIVEKVGPLLTKNGLVWMAFPGRDEHGDPALKYRLEHAPSGESREGEMPLLLSKNDAQGQGSAITYARRYALCAVLNLVADVDDDGNKAAEGAQGGVRYGRASAKPASDKQKALVRRLFTQNNVKRGMARSLLAAAGVEVGAEEDPRAAVDRLEFPGVSELIETLKGGAIPTGETDVPTDPGDFTREPVDPEPMFDPSVAS